MCVPRKAALQVQEVLGPRGQWSHRWVEPGSPRGHLEDSLPTLGRRGGPGRERPTVLCRDTLRPVWNRSSALANKLSASENVRANVTGVGSRTMSGFSSEGVTLRRGCVLVSSLTLCPEGSSSHSRCGWSGASRSPGKWPPLAALHYCFQEPPGKARPALPESAGTWAGGCCPPGAAGR